MAALVISIAIATYHNWMEVYSLKDSCGFHTLHSHHHQYFIIISMVTYLVTALVMISCNVKVIYQFYNMSKDSTLKTNTQRVAHIKKENKVTLIMLSLSISFIVLTLPQPILALIALSSTNELVLLLTLGTQLSVTLNSSVNLALYYISGQTFRDELSLFFRSLC